MSTAKYVLSGIFCLALAVSRAAAEASPVIGPDGLLALSDGSPLHAFKADEGLLRRYRSGAELSRADALRRSADLEAAGHTAGAYGLTVEEAAALAEYSQSAYRVINPRLWQSRLPKERSSIDLMMMIISAMNKLPDHKGKVMRADFYASPSASATEVEERIYAFRKAGGAAVPFVAKAFWSASARSDWNTDIWPVPVNPDGSKDECSSILIEIQAEHAKDISLISTVKEEGEALFRPGAKFEVLSVSPPKKTPPVCFKIGFEHPFTYVIRLRELP